MLLGPRDDPNPWLVLLGAIALGVLALLAPAAKAIA